jgi:hypothetical protein
LNHTDVKFIKVMAKVTYMGLVMNVLVPIGMFVTVMLLLDKEIQTGDGFSFQGNGDVQILFYALLTIAAIDGIATHIIRKKMPAALLQVQGETAFERFEKAAVRFSLVIFVINLSYTFYGLILVFLGAEVEIMMLFMALSLIGYQLFRPRQKYLSRLMKRV